MWHQKNELAILPDLLYSHSHLSQDEIEEQVSGWSYQQKAELFIETIRDYINRSAIPSSLSNKIEYHWDILSSYSTFMSLSSDAKLTAVLQPLTPRYGYDVPEIIIEAGLEELFQDCFDTSLMLHSKLVAAGFDYEAQYATLLGQRMRWQAGCNIESIVAIKKIPVNSTVSTEYHQLVDAVLSKISEQHPLLSEQI